MEFVGVEMVDDVVDEVEGWWRLGSQRVGGGWGAEVDALGQGRVSRGPAGVAWGAEPHARGRDEMERVVAGMKARVVVEEGGGGRGVVVRRRTDWERGKACRMPCLMLWGSLR